MALIEVVGVGSIMPFMTVAAMPDKIHSTPLLQSVYDFFRFPNDNAFMIFLGMVFLGFLVVTNVCQAGMQYVKLQFTNKRRHSLSLRLLEGYLGQDYSFFLNRNTADFVKNINSEVQRFIDVTLMQFVELVSRGIQVLILTVFLFCVNPVSTLAIVLAIVFVYGLIFFLTKRKLNTLGERRFRYSTQLSRVVSEAFWGIKEVKISGSEKVYSDEYVDSSKRCAKTEMQSDLIGDIPKYVLETIAFASIVGFVLLTIIQTGTFDEAAGSMTLYAYAGYRMIPAMQGLFKALTRMKYGVPSARRIIKEFQLVEKAEKIEKKAWLPLPFTRDLEISNLSFTYAGAERPVIQDLALTIHANELVGFAGKTGSGKTTFVDILLGLHNPASGTMTVDGVPVTKENIHSWQSIIGYVPQNIYLSDSTIAANIAFGVPALKIDMNMVRNAAKMAQIDEFIENELPQKYETTVGERGVRLSGGQRQRIGIARALYRDPSLIIMDEATSALDVHTEQALMEAIDSLQGTRTIILIAHRLTTLKKCDRIYLLEKGKIVDQGTYDELESRSSYFNAKH
jgi:ABC-type bacteriocin/lantibiotic exporter with double-glycine peptidase domain